MTTLENQPLQFKVRVDSGSDTDLGHKKPNNEDYVTFFEPGDPVDLEYSGCLYIVADGVGGAKRGEKASEYAAQKLIYEYYQQPKERAPGERLRSILRNIGNEILEYSIQAGVGKMATTLVAAVVRGDRLLVANVGDSRAYLIRNESVEMLTRDHNQLSELLRSGAITPEEGRRSKAGNILTRSIGGHEDVDVDVFPEWQLLPGDLIVLCSDGLHRYLNDEKLLSMTQSGTAEEIAKRLVNYANQAGGADNISALVVSIHSQKEPLPFQHPAVRLEKPESLDKMPTEVKFIHSWKRQKFIFKREYLLVIPSVVLIILIFAIISSKLTGRPPGQMAAITSATGTPTATQDTTLPTPDKVLSANATPAPTNTLAIMLTDTSVATIEGTVIPEQTTTNEVATVEGQVALQTTETSVPGFCVHKAISGSGISQILDVYFPGKKTYDPTKTYTYYKGCNSTTHKCTSYTLVPPEDHDFISPDDFLLIQEIIDQGACEAQDKGGIWIFK